MKIGIKNNKTESHTICSAATGARFIITPGNYIIIDTDSEREINYWTNLKPEVLHRVGLTVYTEDTLDQLTSCPSISYTVQDNQSEQTSFIGGMKEVPEPQATETPDTQGHGFTEEGLLQMEKEDLFSICDNFGIKYKRNNSKKTLVSLILGSGVS